MKISTPELTLTPDIPYSIKKEFMEKWNSNHLRVKEVGEVFKTIKDKFENQLSNRNKTIIRSYNESFGNFYTIVRRTARNKFK